MKRSPCSLFCTVLLSFLAVCSQCFAESASILTMVSPQLRDFVATHAGAMQLLTNTFSASFTGKVIQIYYFYTDNKSTPQASHYYPNDSTVVISLKADVKATDEFSNLIYEMINSQGEKQFQELFRKATVGEVSRKEYALEIMQTEFQAVLKTRDALQGIKLTKNELSESTSFKRFLDCPGEFEEFLAYTKKVSVPQIDPLKGYEAQYDSLRIPQK